MAMFWLESVPTALEMPAKPAFCSCFAKHPFRRSRAGRSPAWGTASVVGQTVTINAELSNIWFYRKFIIFRNVWGKQSAALHRAPACAGRQISGLAKVSDYKFKLKISSQMNYVPSLQTEYWKGRLKIQTAFFVYIGGIIPIQKSKFTRRRAEDTTDI